MKKASLVILILAPLLLSAQFGYKNVTVYDESGYELGQFRIQSDYTSSVNMAVDKYIRYLEEKESRDKAERDMRRINQRAKELGMPSYTGSMGVAFKEGFNSAMYGNANGRQSSSNRSGSSVSVSEWNELVRKYNRLAKSYQSLKRDYDRLNRLQEKPIKKSESLYKPNQSVYPVMRGLFYKTRDVTGGYYKALTVYDKLTLVDGYLIDDLYYKVKHNGIIGYVHKKTIEK